MLACTTVCNRGSPTFLIKVYLAMKGDINIPHYINYYIDCLQDQ